MFILSWCRNLSTRHYTGVTRQEAHLKQKDGKFASDHSTQLNERMEMLKANFTEQHKMVLENRTKEQFKEQDAYFSKIEEKYQHVILCLRK